MTVTVKDAEDAFLYGRSEFEEWREEYMEAWTAPIRTTLMAAILQQLSPEVHAELQRMAPEAYATVTQELGGNNALR